MAKKKKAERKKKKPNGATTWRGSDHRRAAKEAKPARRSARSQVLPGMEGVRSRVLDNLCEGIGDARERLNEAKDEEQGLLGSALERMRDLKVYIYKHAGVELALVPGTDKVRARLVKDKGDVSISEEAAAQPGEIRQGVPDDLGESDVEEAGGE